jgi:hypothetical protein
MIVTLYEQQKYMDENRAHIVQYGFASITQPWIRLIDIETPKALIDIAAKPLDEI